MITLLILLNICHILGDYTHLSTTWMLTAKRIGKPIFPIFCHGLVHASLMWITLHLYLGECIVNLQIIEMVCLLQLVSHTGIDILKGRMNVWFPKFANPMNKAHWYLFGIDQLCHYLIIFLMVHFINFFYIL